MLLRQFSEEDILNIGKLFSTPLGKKVMGSLDNSIYNTVSFKPGIDANTAYFADGQRDLVHLFHNAVNAVSKKESAE